MKKTLDPRDVYWDYRIENYQSDVDDKTLQFELAGIGYDGWELVSIREYRSYVLVPSKKLINSPDRVEKTFIKYIFKKPMLPTDYDNE